MDKEPRVAVVIPMKGKLHFISSLLFSIVYHCKYNRKKLDIYIADTGSSDMEIKLLAYLCSRIKEENGIIIRVIGYKFYNFAKINNDVINNYVRKDTDLIILCNNDIELINDAISICVDAYLKHEGEVGTIGARLMYKDNTVQHAGIYANRTRNGKLGFSHLLRKRPFRGIAETDVQTWGNTGAFLVISYKDYQDYGGLNEEYKTCFEDVELNMRLLEDGRKNFTCLNAVCWHAESATRKNTPFKDDVTRIQSFAEGLKRLPEVTKELATSEPIKNWITIKY